MPIGYLPDDPVYVVEVGRYPCGHRRRDLKTLVDTAEIIVEIV